MTDEEKRVMHEILVEELKEYYLDVLGNYNKSPILRIVLRNRTKAMRKIFATVLRVSETRDCVDEYMDIISDEANKMATEQIKKNRLKNKRVKKSSN